MRRQRKIGDRVYALSSADEECVRLFGVGTYDGDFVPAGAVGLVAEALVEYNITNPRITLDSGEVVYGCECWWGDERDLDACIDGRRVEHVAVAEVRAEVGGASDE